MFSIQYVEFGIILASFTLILMYHIYLLIRIRIHPQLTSIGRNNFVRSLWVETVMEGTVQEVHNALHRYVPFAIFTVYPIVTVDQVEAMIKGLTME